MIEKLTITNKKALPVEWWEDVPSLRRKKTFKFKPGLNILFGPNGSGKTTILLLLARFFQCDQGGIPLITTISLERMFDYHFKASDDLVKDGVKVDHDGQPVHFFNPECVPGIDGGAGFDSDFMSPETISMYVGKQSSGQKTLIYLGRILKSALDLEKVEVAGAIKHCNDLWEHRKKVIIKLLESNIDKGQRTVLLDEPERSVDTFNTILMWERMTNEWSNRFQLIVASPCPLALEAKNANIIPLVPNYLKDCREKLKRIRE